MTSSLLLFDASLAVMLVAVALRVLLARELFQAIVLFIVFGLLLSIAWCRLEAVDVALAEAAIGAGLTGALFLNTLAATGRHGGEEASTAAKRRWTALALGVSTVVATAGMAAIVVPLAVTEDAPRISIGDAMPHSGVAHPVTAVLLNFRAYDTLLEVAVLLLAVLVVLAVTASVGRFLRNRRALCDPTSLGLRISEKSAYTGATAGRPSASGPVLGSFVRVIVPLAMLVAVYVLWVGTKAPGGAFQAAALLAAGGVLSIVARASRLPASLDQPAAGRAAPQWPPNGARRRWRVLLVSGLAVFLLAAWCGMPAGGRFLEYPAAWSGALILLIETALTASIALILIMLFAGTSPMKEDGP
jgi:multisubunit Na+/H+ antiporter MnhB subunit